MAATEIAWILLLALTVLDFVKTANGRSSFSTGIDYEDSDGKSTIKKSASHRLTGILVLGLALLGLLIAGYAAIWTLLHSNGDTDERYVVLGSWQRLAAWVGYLSFIRMISDFIRKDKLTVTDVSQCTEHSVATNASADARTLSDRHPYSIGCVGSAPRISRRDVSLGRVP